MASNLRLPISVLRGRLLPSLKGNFGQALVPVRTKVCYETGALLEKPVHVRFGLIKVACTVTPFLTMGGILSREFAAWLEEHELFVPDEDDDD
ncbi:hypothetical protein BaRGS_00024073 [Batillaria attramentaria]|uniref:Essential MCU regulator, mitochondrial n=1 Tax=Batillaria attramentaria TaxID=370345 RepID=A0ABD0KC44_9CAEN